MPSTCRFDAPFISNNKFTFLRGNVECFNDGKLEFTSGENKPDGSYKTYFSPCYQSRAVVYRANDAGLELAFNFRMGCVRKPETPGYELVGGYHQFLLDQHESFFVSNWELLFFRAQFTAAVELWFLDIGDLDEKLRSYANHPHPKRLERIHALRKVLDNGDLFHKTFNKTVIGKMKNAELAKHGKNSRLVNNLSPEGALLCGFVADQLKQCMATFTHSHWFRFVKSPNLDVLSEIFENLINPVEQLYFPFFSDDSCVSIRCVDGIFMANVDISSCDASHGRAVFEYLRHVSSADSRLYRYVSGAISQCEMPLTLTKNDKTEMVTLALKSPTLYSGSTLTTIINNFANISIACSIKSLLRPGICMDECGELVQIAAAAAGYIVTVVRCHTYHELQLLKHSPLRALCGKIVPVLNFGVILRTLGCCWGDLPTFRTTHGRISTQQRAYLYNVAQVQCYKNYPTFSFLAALRKKFYSDKVILKNKPNLRYVQVDTSIDYSMYVIPDSEIAARYRVSVDDVLELNNTLGYGLMTNITASRAIFNLDYGLCEREDGRLPDEAWGGY